MHNKRRVDSFAKYHFCAPKHSDFLSNVHPATAAVGKMAGLGPRRRSFELADTAKQYLSNQHLSSLLTGKELATVPKWAKVSDASQVICHDTTSAGWDVVSRLCGLGVGAFRWRLSSGTGPQMG